MIKQSKRALRTFLVVGVLTALTSCGQNTATTVEPLTLEALVDVIESSPAEATSLKLADPENTEMLAQRDGENISIEEAIPDEDERESAVALDGEIYVTVRDTAGDLKWARLTGDGASRAEILDALTSDFIQDVTSEWITAVFPHWADFSIVNSSCTGDVCTYDLTAAYDPANTQITVVTESIEGVQRLTSLTMFFGGAETLELGYAPQKITAPDDYTKMSFDLFISGATSDEQLRAVADEAETYLRNASQRANETGLPVTSREFWETYLPGNAPVGVSLWVDVPDDSDGIRKLVGPSEPYNGIEEDLGDTLGRILFEKDDVQVCMDVEDDKVLAGHC